MDLIAEITGGTVFIQIGILLALMLVLHFILFKPYLRLYEERQRRLNPHDESIAQAKKSADEFETEYLSKIRVVREKLIVEVQKLRDEAKIEERKVISSAREKAQASLTGAMARLNSEVEESRKSLNKEAEMLARKIASNLLGKNV